MKRTLLYIVALLALVSCQKDPEIPIVSLTVNDKVEAEWLTANLSGAAISKTKINTFFVQFSTDAGFGTFSEIQAQYESGQFSVSLSNLTPQTTYYYRYRAANQLGSCIEKEIHPFRTKDYVVPVVTTDSVSRVTGKKANLFGTVAFDCGKAITDRGFEWGTDVDHLTKIAANGADFSKQLLQLQFGTQYYYRAYATSEIGTGYGELKSFKTCDVVKFGEIRVYNITPTSARADYEIRSNRVPVLKQGMQYWEQGAKDSTMVSTDKTMKMINLIKYQTYQLRSFVETEDSCFFSEIKAFATKDLTGTSTVLTSSGRSSCDWVQLWDNGPKWATFNVGATISDYVNIVVGADPTTLSNYKDQAPYYNTSNVGGLYAWNNPNLNGRKTTWYNTTTGTNDVATALWGSNWKTPTPKQLDTLRNSTYGKTSWTWCDGTTTQYVAGCTLKGFKVSGVEDFATYCIFLPAAGWYYYNYQRVDEISCDGYYWSSSQYDSSNAYALYFRLDYSSTYERTRKIGCSVRAILAE